MSQSDCFGGGNVNDAEKTCGEGQHGGTRGEEDAP